MTSEKQRKLHEKAMERFKDAQEYEREQRELAEEDFCFVSGAQWPDDVRREREADYRPCLTINRLPVFVSQVVGDARQNKPAIKVLPVDSQSDPDVADVYEGLIRQIEASSKADEAYLTALEHSAQGGFGHFRIFTEFADDSAFEQDIRIKRITNPFSVYWDASAREYDRSDAKCCFVTEWIHKDTFESRYPNATPDDWDAEYRECGTLGWLDDDWVRIAEYWVRETEGRRLGLMETGETVNLDKFPDVPVIRERVAKVNKVVRYVLSGHTVLEGPKEWPGKYIPIVPVWGAEEYHDGRLRPRSVIRYAKDAQRQYNYWQSQITEKIMLAPKSPWLVTTRQIDGLENIWNQANIENRAYLPYNPDSGAPQGPQRNSPASVNAAELQQSANAVEDLKATTGIFDASLGNRSNETSGVAIAQRQREGDTATFVWIDNLGRSIAHAGRILIDLIPRIYDSQRQVRIIGPDDDSDFVPINQAVRDENGQIQLMHDLSAGKYDVRVVMGPSVATQRQEAAQSLIDFVRAVPQAGQVAADLIAKNMDWPGADQLAERLKKILPEGMVEDEEPKPPDPVQQLQLQKLQIEVEKLKAEAAKAASDAGFTQARTQSEQVNTEVKQAETATNIARSEAEIQKIAAETAKIVTDTLIQQGVLRDPNKDQTVNVST